MKPEQLYQGLKDLAGNLGITVLEKNLRNVGLKVESGLCKVKEEQMFIMDKHLSVHKKNRLLASCLRDMPCENIYIVPAIREYLDK